MAERLQSFDNITTVDELANYIHSVSPGPNGSANIVSDYWSPQRLQKYALGTRTLQQKHSQKDACNGRKVRKCLGITLTIVTLVALVVTMMVVYSNDSSEEEVTSFPSQLSTSDLHLPDGRPMSTDSTIQPTESSTPS